MNVPGGEPLQRRVLWTVGAAVAVVAVLLVVVLAVDDDPPDTIETAEPSTTSTTSEDGGETTTSSTPSTVVTTAVPTTAATTAVPPTVPTRTESLASGPDWEILRVEAEGSSCLTVTRQGSEVAERCGLAPPPGVLGEIVTADVTDGAVLVAALGADVGTVEVFPGGQVFGRATLGRVADPFIQGLSFLVTDHGSVEDVLLLRSGQDIVGGIYGQALRTDAPFGRFPGYGRAAESVSLGTLQEIGLHVADGRTCVLARRLLPDPFLVADHCVDGTPTAPDAVTVPTVDPGLVDLFGMVPAASAGDWTCELPDGDTCGSGLGTEVAGTGAAALSGFGPVSVIDSSGQRVDHVVIVLADETRFEVAIPAA